MWLFRHQYIKEYKGAGTGPEAWSFCESSFCVDRGGGGGGGGDRRLTRRGSTLNFHFHVKRWSPLLTLGGGGGGESMIDAERINSQLSLSHEKAITSVDPMGWVGGQINEERINSQLSLLREKVITSVDPGGQINDQHREDQQSTLSFVWKGNHLCWSWGGRQIDSHVGRVNSQCREGQQSTVNVERVNSQCIVPLRTVQPHYLRAKHGVATS